MTARRSLEVVLAEARARIVRLSPAEAWAARTSALIVDIRSERAREAGVVPGSLHLPRTVLEWRLDPDSPWRNPHVGGLDSRLVLLCDHGESSSLAAAALVDLGFTDVADVVGGIAAWTAAGLPLVPAVAPPDGLPGLGPPQPA